ncbi:DNA/RNA polymerase [Aureobasidium sp. EXF-10728]|nr:DNA/RNA polymerase [Aureobasidium sp. EXF-10728]
MSTSRGRNPPSSSHRRRASANMAQADDDDSLLGSRQLEAFGRTVHATASHFISPLTGDSHHYQTALGDIHRELRRPLIQRSVFELAKASPKELVRSTFSTTEIQHRALVHLPDDLLRHIPERSSTYSLFQGFQASKPEEKKKSARSNDKGQKLLGHESDDEADPATPAAALKKLKSKKGTMEHRLEMMGIRKNMCISEIKEIDTKIANLNTMRKIVLQRLAGHEQEEVDLENEIQEMSEKLSDLQEELEDAAALATKSPPLEPTPDTPADLAESTETFMSESVYEKLPAPSPTKTDKEKEKEKKKRRVNRRKSMPVLHEHMEKGSRIREFQAHNDMITALDFDAPFGTLVSAALDDTVRVWDLNAGRCIGLLEGHHASVRCLQVQDNFVATGSMDASIRFWDLNQAEYSPPPSSRNNRFGRLSEDEEDDADMFSDPELEPLPVAPTSSMQDCLVTELSAHVAEVTALHFHKNTLVSGSADKTLRQWDLENGRCVQTLDVMWAAAQASVSNNSFGAPSPAAADPAASEGWWRPASGRLPPAEADFVGAIQVFETALACGTADGMVRLWDLRSGNVHRSLVGHTGPITSLAFSGIHMVTGSADRSVRIWDLRTGGIIDAFAYESPIVDSSVDARHIVSAIGESVVKVYDKTDGNQWDCGPGVAEEEDQGPLSTIERVRIKDGYLVEATVADQHSTTSDSPRWAFGGVEYSLNPKDTLTLQHDLQASLEPPRRLFTNGLAGNVSDLVQSLHTCLRVERFERARLVIEKLRQRCDKDSFEIQHVHGAYLEASLAQIENTTSPDKRESQYEALRDWFENDFVQQEYPVDSQTLVVMMRAAMKSLMNPKQERAIRRYAELAEASEPGLLDEIYDADDFTDDEFMRLGAVLPTLKTRSPQIEQPVETKKELPSSQPDFVSTPDLTDIPAVLEVEQKGMGLASLKDALDAASPALQSSTTLEAMEKARLTPEDRERLLEESAGKAAIARWKKEEENLQKLGIHSTLESKPLGALMWQWYSDLLPVLREEIDICRTVLDNASPSKTVKEQLIYGPFIEAVPVEQLAATTILSVMGSFASGKDRGSGTYNSNQRLGRLTASLGKIMQDEANAEAARQRAIAERKAKLGRAPKKQPKSSHPFFDTDLHVWPSDVRVKLGAMLVSKLIDVAKIPVSRQHPRTKEIVTQAQPAFLHKTLYESGRKQGWLCPSSELIHKLHREPVAGLIAKRLPMVIEPKPWTGFSRGGYLNYPTPVIRFSGADSVPRDYAYAAIQRGDLDKVFEALNVLGKVPWNINGDVLRVQIEAWNSGEPIGNFAPLNPKFDLPPEPEDKSDPQARRVWLQSVKDAENVKSGYHSKRCFQNFQLEIARAFSKEKVYFPHNIDFRGRAYPVPPYLNHMGADNARALMTFAEGKELGEVGLRWLKIHLSNVFGFDKASLSEREQFAMDHLDDIRDSVANPLGGRRWWLESEDAWQTLAACYELKAAMDLPDPTKYVSHLPIHQDGTCNGLQHYAALGGDSAGARQVNLEPGDRPSDVYSAVADGVKAEVEKDFAAGHPVAQFLRGKITRKVVKQPVMTNVYGVTYYGARAQVKKQLEEIFPEIHRHDALDHLTLASYVAKKIFKSLGEMFTGAQAIQKWLGDCADRISTCVTPEQLASMKKDHSEGRAIIPEKPVINKGKPKGTSVQRSEASKHLFRSSVIWTTPLRLPVVQPYRTSKRRQVKTNLQHIALQEPSAIDPVSKRKQLQGFPPNFIHSLDATHMMLSAIKCNENNIAFASIHDSFWTHACDVNHLSVVLRDAFVAMHTEDVVGRLRQEFIARYKGCMYLAAVDIRTPVGKKIAALQKARPKGNKKNKQLQPTLILQLLEETERLRLLNSENPEEVAQGEEMLTSGSIFADEADAEDALTVPPEIVNARLGEIPENPDILGTSESGIDDLIEPVLSDHDDVDSTSDDKVAKAAEDADVDVDEAEEHVPTVDDLKKKSKATKKPPVKKVYVWLPLKFPEVPAKGDFDVTRLKESRYFFH